MKTVVGLILMVVVLSGIVVGCKSSQEKATYREVSLGRMMLSIPGDWKRPEQHVQMREQPSHVSGLDLGQAMQSDFYVLPESKDVLLELYVTDMERLFELQGSAWESWGSLGADGVTKEQYSMTTSYRFASSLGEDARKMHRRLPINGIITWESRFSGQSKNIPVNINVLVIFANNHQGILVLTVNEANWKKFKGTWEEIMGSVKFPSSP